jgi:hypothetical protein
MIMWSDGLYLNTVCEYGLVVYGHTKDRGAVVAPARIRASNLTTGGGDVSVVTAELSVIIQ